MPGCLAPAANDHDSLIVATQAGLIWYNWENQTSEMWLERTGLEDKPNNRFNDGKVDPAGRLWAGTLAVDCQGTEGTLFCFEADKTSSVKRTQVGISNGLAWSPDNTKMYFIDSPTLKVVGWDYDISTGNITNERDVITFPSDEGIPDGMTIDEDGFLWVAKWGGAKIQRVDPNNGKVVQEVQIPALNVTSCCFGGANLDVLYVTCASMDTDTTQYPHAGHLFEVRNTGTAGLPLNNFTKG